jgi:hypothetical protein
MYFASSTIRKWLDVVHEVGTSLQLLQNPTFSATPLHQPEPAQGLALSSDSDRTTLFPKKCSTPPARRKKRGLDTRAISYK